MNEIDAALVDRIQREVVTARFTSRSMLQWRFGLSGTDAERVLQALEARGVVGPAGPDLHRDVLVPADPNAEFWAQDADPAEEWWTNLPPADTEVPGLMQTAPAPGVNQAALVTVPPLLPPDEPWRVPSRPRHRRSRTVGLAVGTATGAAACGLAAWLILAQQSDVSAAPTPTQVTVTTTVTVPAPTPSSPSPARPSASPSSASPSPSKDDTEDSPPPTRPHPRQPRPAYTPPHTHRPQPTTNRGWCPIRDSNGKVIGYVRCPG
ncbi:hypothetical protein [Actinomadura rupiterrae]|uniref:hypothetical protein n=1 Tax=Actinomadura rupiterrae TaxID=559627 RepID=UPI0020A5E799|nr:hypothetical protein [Actinomadura rupiterrae]MCP2341608.1 hypothetical protein [Actinomadura rupiterrae]